MTPAAKFAYIAAALVGLFLGISLGFRKASSTFEVKNTLQRSMASAEFAHFSYLQYKYANPERANEALLMNAKFLEEIERLKPDKIQEHNLGAAYLRLAVQEDAAHHPEQSRAHMEKAKYWYKIGGGRDYSEDQMKVILKKFDENVQP